MSESVELSSLDLRYQGHRLRDGAREARLLASIAERGIEDPLEGIDTPNARFLLNGFKRYRCAKKLGIQAVPYQSLGNEEATGIVNLMRVSTSKGLGILEQARFITDLLTLHGMSLAEVAQTLGRSKGWVAMRRGLLDQMSEPIQDMLFAGRFPVYCYLYTLAPFRRMNGAARERIERFMQAVSGQRFSVRDIELLARAYFEGPDSLRGAIESGKLGWSLKQLKSVPEMVAFGQRYGFCFLCHEIRHANRKAGEERSFWTVETNFLKGRVFESLEDLNRQALEWATVRMHHRRMEKTGWIPAQAFEQERRYLTEVSPHLPAPYRVHPRGTDQYGYVSFLANYYWVSGVKREDVKLLEYADRLKIYWRRECVAEYPLPENGVQNARFSPEGQPTPRHSPNNRKQRSQCEEKRLRALDVDVAAYVDYVLRTPGIKHHHFLRALWALSQRVPAAAFVQALRRALRYRVIQLPQPPRQVGRIAGRRVRARMSGRDFRERASAVRGIPLETVLLARGATRDPQDRSKWHTERGPLSITGEKFFSWGEDAGRGGAIDLVMHLAAVDCREAIVWLERNVAGKSAVAEPPRPRKTSSVASSQTSFQSPSRDERMLDRVRDYLTRRRYLSAMLLEPLLEAGRLYADRRGNAVFLLVAGKSNRPVGAELRGTGPRAWRGLAPGSRKDVGYFWVGACDSRRIVLCESAIDAISCFQLHLDHICVSTSGARANPPWLHGLIARGYHLHCGFDTDVAGELAASRMIALYPSIARLRPAAHDWNDLLSSKG